MLFLFYDLFINYINFLFWIVCLFYFSFSLYNKYHHIMILRYCCFILNNLSFFSINFMNTDLFVKTTSYYSVKTWFLSNLTNYTGTLDNNLFIFSLLILCICYCCWQIHIFILKNKYKDINNILQREQRLLFYWSVQFCAFISLVFTIWLATRLLIIMMFSDYVLLQIPVTSLIIKFLVSLFVLSWWFMFLWSYKNKPISLFKTVYNVEAIILYFLAIFLLYKLIDCQDLLEFTLLFESSSLLFCILCALSTNIIASVSGSLKHVEAALKLYINTSVSSGFLLLGFGLIYGSTGCYILTDIYAVNQSNIFPSDMLVFDEYNPYSHHVVHNPDSAKNIENWLCEKGYCEGTCEPSLVLQIFYDYSIDTYHLKKISFLAKNTSFAFNELLDIFWSSSKVDFVSHFQQANINYFTLADCGFYPGRISNTLFSGLKPDLFLLGCLCFFVAFGLKLTIVPMHLWILDIYEGSSILFISFIGIIPKIVIWFIFAKFYIIYFQIDYILAYVFFVLGFLTSLYAALNSYTVLKVKEFLALSTILTSGYILMVLAYGGSLNFFAIILCVVYLTTYAIGMSSILIFIITQPAFIDYELKLKSKNLLLDFLKTDWNLLASWSGLYKIERLYAFILILAIFTCLGIPPFSGFISKFFIFKMTTGSYIGSVFIDKFLSFELGQVSFAILFLMISLLSIILYLRMVKVIMFNYLTHHSFFSFKNPLIIWLQSLHALVMLFLFIGITILSIFLHFILY